MPDALQQTDIDTLLSAVNTGEVAGVAPAGSVNGGTGRAADHAEIFSRFRRDFENIEIRDYDFKRPERISKDQMRALCTLHDTFARNFGASLSGFLRTIVEVRIVEAEQKTYAEFTAGLPNPTSFNLVQCPPLDGQMCLELSPLIIYPLIDRLLGGSNRDLFIPQRAMTLIEQRLIRRILNRGMAALSEAWQAVKTIEFALGEMESNPQIVQIVPPNEVVVVITFEIKMTNRAGTMNLCIPFNVIEPLIEGLSSQNWSAMRRAGETQWEPVIARGLSDATLEVTGVLAETTMTISELRNLEVGDVVTTEKPANTQVALLAGGRPKFLADIGQYKGRRALKIVRAVKAGERVEIRGERSLQCKMTTQRNCGKVIHMHSAEIRPHVLSVMLATIWFAGSASAQIDSSLFSAHWQESDHLARTLDEVALIPSGDSEGAGEGGSDDISIFRWDSTGHIRMSREDSDPHFTIGYRFLNMSLGGDGLAAVPDDFNDLALVGAYRFGTAGEGDWRISLLGGAGTANDGHWTNSDAVYGIGAIDFERQLDTDSVLHLGIEYYGNRLYMRDVPLPVVRYEYRMDKDFSFVLGFPTSQFVWHATSDISLEGDWTLAQHARLTASYGFDDQWSIFGEFEQSADGFVIDGTGGDRLFYNFSRVVGGLRWKSDFIDAQFGLGYAFGQEFTVGDENLWSSDGLSDVSDGLIVMLNLRGTF